MHYIVRQATSFSVKHRFPIIAHVEMHANHFCRHRTFPYCRHRQAADYFRLQASSPYNRSHEYARKPFYRQIPIRIDTSTSKMLRMEKLRKSIRPNRQNPRVPTKPEVNLNFRGHPNSTAM